MPIGPFCHLISLLALLIPDLIFHSILTQRLNHKRCIPDKELTSHELNHMLLNLNTSFFHSDHPHQSPTNVTQCLLVNFFIFILKPSNSNNSNQLMYETWFLLEELNLYKLELISLACALLVMFTRYGSVFWHTNKFLAFLVTFIGLLASVQQIFQLYSFVYISNLYEIIRLYKEIKRALLSSDQNLDLINQVRSLVRSSR